MRLSLSLAILSATLLAGCTNDLGAGNYAFVVQDKYDHMKCKEFDANIKAQEAELRRLEGLNAKASQSAVGSMIGAGTYSAGMAEARGNIRVLQKTFDAKNCTAELKAAR